MLLSKTSRSVAVLGAVAVVGAYATPASAQCCPNYSPTTACAGIDMQHAVICVADSVKTGLGTATVPTDFCGYADTLVGILEQKFGVILPAAPFEIDAAADSFGNPTNTFGASTQCGGSFGANVTFDAFTGAYNNVNGYNAYVGISWGATADIVSMVSGGWPTDWWEGHENGFTDMATSHVMASAAMASNDSGATAAVPIFQQGVGSNTDHFAVTAMDSVHSAMPGGDGLAGFGSALRLVQGDTLDLTKLGANPSAVLSEYVIAYTGLAMGLTGNTVLGTLQDKGYICNNQQDPAGDPAYTCTESDIDAIANAHCALAANRRPAPDVAAFQQGKYANVGAGPCGSACPVECGCNAATGQCEAPWVAGATGGGSSSSSGSTSSSGGSSGSGSSSGGSSGSSSGISGSSGSGSGSGSSGSGSGSGSSTGSGSTSGSGSSTGSGSTSGSGSTGGSSSGSSGSSSGSEDFGAPPSTVRVVHSGCGIAPAGESSRYSWGAGLLFAGIALGGGYRARGRRPRGAATR